jgi:hypothetical protein
MPLSPTARHLRRVARRHAAHDRREASRSIVAPSCCVIPAGTTPLKAPPTRRGIILPPSPLMGIFPVTALMLGALTSHKRKTGSTGPKGAKTP